MFVAWAPPPLFVCVPPGRTSAVSDGAQSAWTGRGEEERHWGELSRFITDSCGIPRQNSCVKLKSPKGQTCHNRNTGTGEDSLWRSAPQASAQLSQAAFGAFPSVFICRREQMFVNLQLKKFPSFLFLVFLSLPSSAAQGSFPKSPMADLFSLLTIQQSRLSLSPSCSASC